MMNIGKDAGDEWSLLDVRNRLMEQRHGHAAFQQVPEVAACGAVEKGR